jgi:hypothetical protein
MRCQLSRRKNSSPTTIIVTALDARLYADRAEFYDRRWPNEHLHPLALWGMSNRVGYLAGIAKRAGDLETHDRLKALIARRHARAKLRRFLSGQAE